MRISERAIATTVIAMLASASVAQEPASIGLLFTGTFLGPGPYPSSGESWLAAYRSGSGIVLEKTRIDVTEIPHTCTGMATRITATDVNEPLFLVRGSREFQPGPLETVFDEPRFIYPAESFSLQLESGRWFGFQAYGSAKPAVGEVFVDDYEIRMYQGTRTQTLAEFRRIDWDGPPRLIWAGDLDRDGNLDALLDLTTAYAGHLYTLFISSAARDGQLVARVAEFSIVGC